MAQTQISIIPHNYVMESNVAIVINRGRQTTEVVFRKTPEK